MACASLCTSGSWSAGSRLTPMPVMGMRMLLPRKPATMPPCVPELPEPTTTRSMLHAGLEQLLLQFLRAGHVAQAARAHWSRRRG
jgi:hypothetical protein